MTYLVASLLFLLMGCARPEPADESAAETPAVQQMDSPAKLVASMTKYQVGVLWKGPKWTDEASAMVDQRIREKSHAWRAAVTDGKLVGAVRVLDPVDLWGLLFFKIDSPEEMEMIAQNAQSVKDGLLAAQVVKVWGTRGLGSGLQEKLTDDPNAPPEKQVYYMAIFRKGESWLEDAEDPKTREATSEGIQFLYDLYKNGNLRYYAAVEDFTLKARGMAVLSASSQEEALSMISQSPMVQKKYLTVDVTGVEILEGVLP
jgi:hypothetical protein